MRHRRKVDSIWSEHHIIWKTLFAEAEHFKALADKDRSDIHRRSFCRSLFCMVDAMSAWLKRYALEEYAGLIGPDTKNLLAGVRIYSSPDGRIVEKLYRPSLEDHVFHAIDNYCWPCGSDYSVSRVSQEWKCFQKAIKVRNRLTHPKAGLDLIVTDLEYDLLVSVFCWHQKTFIDMFESCNAAVRKDLKQRRQAWKHFHNKRNA